jgi:hypothetical protein
MSRRLERLRHWADAWTEAAREASREARAANHQTKADFHRGRAAHWKSVSESSPGHDNFSSLQAAAHEDAASAHANVAQMYRGGAAMDTTAIRAKEANALSAKAGR